MIKRITKVIILYNILVREIFCQDSYPSCEISIQDDINQECISDYKLCTGFIIEKNFGKVYCQQKCEGTQIVIYQGDGYKECVECDKNVYELSSGDRICAFSCPQDEQIEYYDESQFLYKCLKQPSDCPFFMQLDGKKCLVTCPKGFFQVEQIGYKQCQVCDKLQILQTNGKYTCGTKCSNENEILDLGTNTCLSSIQNCESFISLDEKQCLQECPDGQYPNTDQKPIKCTVCDKKSLEITQDGYIDRQFICADSCPQFYDINKKICVWDCPKDSIKDEKTKQCYYSRFDCKDYLYENIKVYQQYFFCSNQCPEYSQYHLDKQKDSFSECSSICDLIIFNDKDGKQRCSKKCPEKGQIADFFSQTCITSFKECKGFISTDLTQCLLECDFSKHQTSKQMDGYRQCVYCDGYLVYNPNISGYSCVQTCPSGYLYVQRTKLCLTKNQCTENLFVISENETSCNETCIFPEILQVDRKCLNSCKNISDCKFNCPKGQYLQSIGQSQLKCSLDCKIKLSSNSLYCISKCSDINELEPLPGTNKCRICPQGEYPFQSQDSTLECRIDTIANIQNEKLNFIKRVIQNYTLRSNFFILQTLKNILSEYQTQQVQLTQDKLQLKKFYDDIASYLQQGFNNQDVPQIFTYFDYVVIQNQDVGSIFVTKNRDIGVKFSYKFYDQQITTQSFFEHIDLDVEDSDNLVVANIKNPYCIKDCTSSNLFILYKFDQNIQQQRILQEQPAKSQITFTIDTSLKFPQRVVCVTYDEQGEFTVLKTTPSTDKKTVTCQFSENAAYMYDEKCKYLPQIQCVEQELQEEFLESDDNSLSTSEIIGIAIGCFVFVVAVIFFITRYYKKKNSKINRVHSLQSNKEFDANDLNNYNLKARRRTSSSNQIQYTESMLKTINV